jgi:hypothetical protein
MDGEWWIDTEGTAHYADGDIGDINHENFVVVHCMHEVLDLFENSDNELLGVLARYLKRFIEDDGVDIIAVNEFIINWSDMLHREGKITDDQVNDIYSYLRELSGLDEELFDVCFDRDKDCRAYGIKRLGWVRVARNNVECYEANPGMLRTIAKGLWDAMDMEVDQQRYMLEELANGKWYLEVPYAVFENASMSGLRQYQRRY